MQLNVIIDKSNQTLDATNKIVTLKQCRGRTAVEQAYSAFPVFCLFKVIANTVTT